MKEAMFYEKQDDYCQCNLCPHYCKLHNGQTGRCNVRQVKDNKLYSLNYGKLTAVQIDPIEKKPIRGWMKGSKVLSIGSYGCNLHCSFCQNYEISLEKPKTIEVLPGEIIDKAIYYKVPSIAYTYNEPTVFYEMMFDTAKLALVNGINNVIVTNGFINDKPLLKIIDYIDAMNIDIKTYSDKIYKNLGANTVRNILNTIDIVSKRCHVEVTILIVPGISDSINDIELLLEKLAKINDNIILHISRYFPRYQHYEPATDIGVMMEIQRKALKHFKHVYLGNVR
ncbi:MAG: AmmeMemoRadiSam system radical SAM enzyme [Eubacteriaceae bacterium]